MWYTEVFTKNHDVIKSAQLVNVFAARVLSYEFFYIPSLLVSPLQIVYERCRGRVLDRMRMSLSEVGSVSTNSEEMSVTESEALHDACRAYGLLLHSSQLRQVPEHEEISNQVYL